MAVSRTLVSVLLPVMLSLAVASGQSGRDLPEAIRTQLSAAYPGWRFASLDAQYYPELSAEVGRRRSPEWVTGDFDGDRRADYAVAIVRPGTPTEAHVVLAFLGGPRGYERVVVRAMPEQTDVYLRVSRQGDRVRDYSQDADGRVSFILRHDAIDIVSAGKAATTCLYDFGLWRCFVSAD